MEVIALIYDLSNNSLSLKMDQYGAELISICDINSNTQYLWNADPIYWKRHSPILFPFVGSLNQSSYRYQDALYPMTQHGFARDTNFTVMSKTDQEIWFSLEADSDTYAVYPFRFRLEVGYRLTNRTITVFWKVYNNDDKVMYFSIGGHPAFNCPIDHSWSQTDYFLCFDTDSLIRYQHINKNGLLIQRPFDKQNKLTADYGILPINPHLFDFDALIIENNQCHKVSILSPDKIPILTVSFDAPLFGLWSPSGKNAPFICIEPWYGRCDAENFHGTLEEREWGNALKPGEIFTASYRIEIA